MGPNQPEIGQ